MINQTTIQLSENDLYTIVSIDRTEETCVLKLEKNGETFFIQDFQLSELRKPVEQ